jgi:hypothetical protein
MSSAVSQTEHQSGTLRIAALLEPRSKSDRLTVVLNGYCDRSTRTPPVFAEWPESSETWGHILRISDPSLFLSDWINASCFLGTEAENPVPPIVQHAKHVAHQLGVAENRMTYFGHSGAGFGAVQCAVYHREACALAVNPILDIEQYKKYNFAKAMVGVFRPHAQFDEIMRDYPERFSITEAVRRTRKNHPRACLGIIQNILDTHHYAKHFIPFCKSVGISRVGGADETGLIQAQTCILRGGHSARPIDGLAESLLLKLLFLRSQSTPREQP